MTQEETFAQLKSLHTATELLLGVIHMQPEENVMLQGSNMPFLQSSMYRGIMSRVTVVRELPDDPLEPRAHKSSGLLSTP